MCVDVAVVVHCRRSSFVVCCLLFVIDCLRLVILFVTVFRYCCVGFSLSSVDCFRSSDFLFFLLLIRFVVVVCRVPSSNTVNCFVRTIESFMDRWIKPVGYIDSSDDDDDDDTTDDDDYNDVEDTSDDDDYDDEYEEEE